MGGCVGGCVGAGAFQKLGAAGGGGAGFGSTSKSCITRRRGRMQTQKGVRYVDMFDLVVRAFPKLSLQHQVLRSDEGEAPEFADQ